MESIKIKAYNNLIISLFLFFIPFSYALTFKVGFPLKISEITLVLLVILVLTNRQLKLEPEVFPVVQTLTLFCLFSFISLIINLFWQYNYQLDTYEARFGYKIDSILKFCYLMLAYFCFIISYKIFLNYKAYALKIYFRGAVISSIYCWYLFLTSLFNFPTFLLPGMDAEPQMILLSFGDFIRSGTFKEGNYMGMFLLLSGIMAFYCDKKKLGFFLFLTIIPTVSSMAILNVFLFLFLFYFKKFFTRKNFNKLILFFAIIMIAFSMALGNKDFKFLVTAKIFGSTKNISNNAEFSKADRLNSSMTALEIGLNNPFLGVGMSNYSLHNKEYNYDNRFYKENFKSIPNNIYLEIVSEQGILGLAIFILFLLQLYKISQKYRAVALQYGLISTFIYFVAFPTYIILFIWVFFGLVAALPNNHFEQEVNVNKQNIYSL